MEATRPARARADFIVHSGSFLLRFSLLLTALFLAVLMAQATSVKPKELAELLAESDHVLICKVVKVQMVDEKGKEVTDPNARTGPGQKNELRLHVTLEPEGVLKTSAKEVPAKLVIPLWPAWHYSLESVRSGSEGKTNIFLLKGANFQRTYEALFNRSLEERPQIEKILREQKVKNAGASP